MPHQCLSCGETFADGSDDLLKGCPSCEGTQFFFTEEPLDEDEREELAEQSDRSAQQMLEEILEDEDSPDLDDDIFSRGAWEDWIKEKVSGEDGASLDREAIEEEIAAGDGSEVSFEPLSRDEEKDQLRESESVQVSLEEVQETDAPEIGSDEEEISDNGALEPLDPEAHEQAIEMATEGEADGQPSTLNIRNPGEYEIDVRRLMEDSPVIVERDGSYVIHLPSVFERKDKKK